MLLSQIRTKSEKILFPIAVVFSATVWLANLVGHFEKHLDEFPGMSKLEEYYNKVNDFLDTVGEKFEYYLSGDSLVKYSRETEEYAVVNANKEIQSFYKRETKEVNALIKNESLKSIDSKDLSKTVEKYGVK